jgi:AbrB family looped-hinge helix DNA binding protein
LAVEVGGASPLALARDWSLIHTLWSKNGNVALRITSKGQVTIPIALREQAGLLPNTEVEFELDGAAVRIVRAKRSKRPSRGERLIEHLRGRGDSGMTTDEIMALTRGE